MFTLTSDVEEGGTRSEEISLDYDFFHSHLMALSCGNDYTVKVTPRDINIFKAVPWGCGRLLHPLLSGRGLTGLLGK